MQREFVTIDGAGHVMIQECSIPELQENEVLIKVHASLISPGTEIGTIKRRRENPEPQIPSSPFGYANAGEIIDIKGKGKELKQGMRVAAMGGGYAIHANYACVPVNLVVPIPEQVSYTQATYACLGATALHCVRRTKPLLGEYGMVLGLGIVGNLTAQLCQLSGSRVIAWEKIEVRRKIATRCNLQNTLDPQSDNVFETIQTFTGSYGADFAVFAFGGQANDALKQVMECIKVSADGHKMGRITLVGGCHLVIEGGAALGNIDLRMAGRTGPGYHDPAYEYGADYPRAFVDFTTQRNLREIVRLMAEKRLLVDPVTTHVMPLTQIAEATELLINQPSQALGVVLTMNH